MEPGALISMECRVFLHDKEGFVHNSTLEMVHLFKLPEGLKLMTEVRIFSATAKVFLIFKNTSKKEVTGFPELMPVALVRAHVHSRTDPPCKKNTPPPVELEIGDDDEPETTTSGDNEAENKDSSKPNEVTEITLE